MKRLILTFLLFTTATTYALAEESKGENPKHWLVAIGPVFSSALLGTGGTKYNILFGYRQGLAERVDLLYFYDGAFNSSSMGSTAVTEIGAALTGYMGDRGADTTSFVRLDLGYGGANRYVDASAMGGLALGVQLFRTKESSFEVFYRHNTTLTQATTNIGAYPTVDEVDFGVIF